MIEGEEQLRALKNWFDSGEAWALVRAYQADQITGTMGTLSREPKAAVHTQRGVLQPDRFLEYMEDLQTQVDAALSGQGFVRIGNDRGLQFLQSTLGDMIGSVSFGERTESVSGRSLKDLFENGRTMRRVLVDYAKVTGQHWSKEEGREA